MSSKIIFRSCNSSVRTLINRHILPTITTSNIQTEPLTNIYTSHYLLPNTFVPQPVNIGYSFGAKFSGDLVLEDAAVGRRKFVAAKRNVEEETIDEELDDDDDDDEVEYSVSDDDDDDDYEDDDYEDDDGLGTDDD